MSRPHEIKEQRLGDRVIDTDNYNRIGATAARAANTHYDRRFFRSRIDNGRPVVSLLIVHIKNWVLRWLMDRVAFGYKINQGDGTVTIRSGRCATLNASQSVTETDVTIGAGATSAAPHYVYVRFEIDDITTAEIPTTALASYPVTTQLWYNHPLYAFSREGNVIRLEKIHHLGDVVADLRR